MKEHIAVIHEGKKRNRCNICGKHLSTKHHMNKHIELIHKGIKPHKCLQCGASFARNLQLDRHLTSVHEGKKPHDKYNASFSQSQNLKKTSRCHYEGKKSQISNYKNKTDIRMCFCFHRVQVC